MHFVPAAAEPAAAAAVLHNNRDKAAICGLSLLFREKRYDTLTKKARRGSAMLSDRQGLIIWLYQMKHTKHLRRFGNVHYASKRMKYAVLYCDRKEIEQVKAKIESLPFVRKVDYSMKPFLKTEYENAKPDKAKEYDYKIGL